MDNRGFGAELSDVRPSRFGDDVVLKVTIDGRDAFLEMSSAYYDRTCSWSADIFTSVWQENLSISLILKYLRGHFNGKCGKLS